MIEALICTSIFLLMLILLGLINCLIRFLFPKKEEENVVQYAPVVGAACLKIKILIPDLNKKEGT